MKLKNNEYGSFSFFVGSIIFITILFAAMFAGTYLNYGIEHDLYENIDLSTDEGEEANRSLGNISKDFNDVRGGLETAAFVAAVTLPLVGIVLIKKVLVK